MQTSVNGLLRVDLGKVGATIGEFLKVWKE